MAILNTRRLIRYVVFVSLIVLAYHFWPVSQIEKWSGEITAEEKNEYIDSILNPKQNSIYEGNNNLKAEFNPDSGDFDQPDVIDIKKVNKALNKMNMKPINEDSQLSDSSKVENEKIDILTNKLMDREYTPSSNLVGFLGTQFLKTNQDYYADLTCKDTTYNPTSDDRKIVYSEPLSLDDDLIEVRKWLLNSRYANLVKAVDPRANDGTFLSDISHWYKKSGSSTWLPDEQLHMVVSTIVYAPNDREEPLVSFLRLQLFNNNWEEVKGRRIRYTQLSEKEIDSAIKEYAKSNEERHLERISLRFPSILNIPISGKPGRGTLGPNDPKILYKEGEYDSEPVIVFNMMTADGKRNMFAVSPFRAPKGPELEHPILKFKNVGSSISKKLSVDKNWVPFFDGINIGDSKSSRGYIHFAYTLDPLVVVKCSLDSGKCIKVQDNVKFSANAKNEEAFIRGGTPFYPVPRQVIQALNDVEHKRLQMWVGFPNVLIKENACHNDIYRPVFSLLVKEDGIYRVELLTGPLDLGISAADVCSNNGNAPSSVIVAQGISFWDVASTGVQENENSLPYYKDHMGIIIGEGNNKIEMFVLKNVLNYALGVYTFGTYLFGNYDIEGPNGVAVRTQKVCECALQNALLYGESVGPGNGANYRDPTVEVWN